MQDEVNEKVVALSIKTSKLTAEVLQKAMILSRLVDTFSSRILYPMLPLSENHSIAVV